jgi:hypothetical protein
VIVAPEVEELATKLTLVVAQVNAAGVVTVSFGFAMLCIAVALSDLVQPLTLFLAVT